jgi:hypothetical protein
MLYIYIYMTKVKYQFLMFIVPIELVALVRVGHVAILFTSTAP